MNVSSVAVVILNFNGKKYLEKFLPSVIASAYAELQVIVADNGSSDDSISFLQQQYPAVRIIDLQTNHGFAGGYNKALEQVEADVFLLLNSDVEVTPGWISPLIQVLNDDHDIAAVQPKIRAYLQQDHFEYAGACGGWIDSLGYPFARGRVFETLEKDNGQYEDVQQVFWATGAALCIRSDVWRKSGGFDESFFAHQEEIDLCWRIQLMGHKIVVCPASVVYHVGGGTLPKGGRKTFLNFRNNLMMLWKNLPGHQKMYRPFVRMLLDWAFAAKSLVTGDVASFSGVIKAHLAFIRFIFSYYPAGNLSKKRLDELNGVYKGSIVWKYFVQGRKEFSEIVKSRRS